MQSVGPLLNQFLKCLLSSSLCTGNDEGESEEGCEEQEDPHQNVSGGNCGGESGGGDGGYYNDGS